MSEPIGDPKVREAVMQELGKGPVDIFPATPIEQGGPSHIERGLILLDLVRAGVVTAEPIAGEHGAGQRFELKPRVKKLAEKVSK